jgi:hypothetical protein
MSARGTSTGYTGTTPKFTCCGGLFIWGCSLAFDSVLCCFIDFYMIVTLISPSSPPVSESAQTVLVPLQCTGSVHISVIRIQHARKCGQGLY